MALVNVAGTALKEPSKYNGSTSDIVDNGRNVQGVGVFDVIRTDVAKVEMEWNYCTCAEWSGILKLFNPQYGGAFINSVTFFDQCKNGYETRQMYVSDRKAGLVSLNADGSPKGWQNCSLSLIEV